jgi:23S rRNA pseudouridine1911/1915/1917 synthase
MPERGRASIHQVCVDAAADGERLDRVLAAALEGVSRSRLKALIEAACVHLIPTGPEAADAADAEARALTQPAHKMRAGQTVRIAIPPDAPAEPEPQDIPLSILHEDADVLVIEKPAGLVVHPAPGNPDRTLVNAVLGHLAHSGGVTSVGGVERPGIVHRLDKDTSGLMVVAKTDAAHRALVAQFQARTIDRAYEALVWGHPTPPQGSVEAAIGRDPRNRKRMAVVARGGKPALTHFRVIRRFDAGVSLVECRLATGRTHQIRVHMAHIGHPVVGDPVYGRRRTAPGSDVLTACRGQLLHAYRLGFQHPASGDHVVYESRKLSRINNIIDTLEP